MKVILTKDIVKLGKEGDIINVSGGYARNYLIPRKVAVPATGQNLAIWEKKKKNMEAKLAKERKGEEELALKLRDLSVKIKVDTGESGKLFGSVTSADIVEAIKAASGIEIDKRNIELPENIKGIGTYEVPIKLHPEVEAKVKVEILSRAETSTSPF